MPYQEDRRNNQQPEIFISQSALAEILGVTEGRIETLEKHRILCPVVAHAGKHRFFTPDHILRAHRAFELYGILNNYDYVSSHMPAPIPHNELDAILSSATWRDIAERASGYGITLAILPPADPA